MKKTIFIYLSVVLLGLETLAARKTEHLVILHTNDTHSQVEPTDPHAVRYPDMGGYARRLGVIDSIRRNDKNVLLFDSGDFSQGTPYYNFFSGRVEVGAYNKMKYDAVTLGNHEFDNGMDSLAMLLARAEFPVLASNYDVSESAIADYIKPYLILHKGDLKVGVMALCVEPEGLIMEANYRGVVYRDPVETARKVSAMLKKEEKCDVVICLSHLGSDSLSVDVNDFQVAHQTEYIDVILGGHSHTLLENTTTPNAVGRPVIIAQMGKSGLFLGRIDLTLTH